MRPPSKTFPYSKTASTANITLLIATLLARTCAATLPTPPSPADQWLYPDVNTLPTYNYLDTVNASWTSNFVDPYLLLRCQQPSDAAHYAYPYNRSVSATGSALVPLDDGTAWLCHFEVSDRRSSNNATPPAFISNDFDIVINNGQNPVLWTDSQDGGDPAVSNASSTPATAAPPTTTRTSASSTPTSSITNPQIPLTSGAPTPTATAPTTSLKTATSSATTPTAASPLPSPTSPSPSTTTTGMSKSTKTAIIVGATMGVLLLLVIAIAVLFVLRTRRSERNAVVYRSGAGDGYGGKGVSVWEAPRERWKGVEVVPSGRMQGYF